MELRLVMESIRRKNRARLGHTQILIMGMEVLVYLVYGSRSSASQYKITDMSSSGQAVLSTMSAGF